MSSVSATPGSGFSAHAAIVGLTERNQGVAEGGRRLLAHPAAGRDPGRAARAL